MESVTKISIPIARPCRACGGPVDGSVCVACGANQTLLLNMLESNIEQSRAIQMAEQRMMYEAHSKNRAWAAAICAVGFVIALLAMGFLFCVLH